MHCERGTQQQAEKCNLGKTGIVQWVWYRCNRFAVMFGVDLLQHLIKKWSYFLKVSQASTLLLMQQCSALIFRSLRASVQDHLHLYFWCTHLFVLVHVCVLVTRVTVRPHWTSVCTETLHNVCLSLGGGIWESQSSWTEAINWEKTRAGYNERERERHKQRASETHTNTNLQSKLIYSKQNTIHLVSGDNTLIKTSEYYITCLRIHHKSCTH